MRWLRFWEREGGRRAGLALSFACAGQLRAMGMTLGGNKQQQQQQNGHGSEHSGTVAYALTCRTDRSNVESQTFPCGAVHPVWSLVTCRSLRESEASTNQVHSQSVSESNYLVDVEGP